MEPVVFLIDDDESFLKSMQRRLFAYGMKVQCFRSPTEFLLAFSPDMDGVILTDLQMPGMSGFDLQDELNSRKSTLSIVFISGKGDIPTSVRAVKNGAESFLTKMIDTTTLLDTINKAIQASRRRKQAQDARSKIRQQIEDLSTRELQVILGLLKGQSNRQIAEQIRLAERTVKYHRTMIARRHSMNSPVEIARNVWKAGFTESQLDQMIQERIADHDDDEEVN